MIKKKQKSLQLSPILSSVNKSSIFTCNNLYIWNSPSWHARTRNWRVTAHRIPSNPPLSNKQCGEKRRAARATLTQFTAGSHCSLITPLQSAMHSTRMSREMSGFLGTPHSRPDNWVILAKRARRGASSHSVFSRFRRIKRHWSTDKVSVISRSFWTTTGTINSTKQMCKIIPCIGTTWV